MIYAVPGVPYEMAEMFERGILPDLRPRMAAAGEENVIASRVIRTWGASESGLAEALEGRIDALDGAGRPMVASRWPSWRRASRGSRSASRPGRAEPAEGPRLSPSRKEVRAIVAERLGDIVFGVDEE